MPQPARAVGRVLWLWLAVLLAVWLQGDGPALAPSPPRLAGRPRAARGRGFRPRRAAAAPLEFPLRTLTLPERFIGTGYILVELLVRNSTALTLLLDTGLTAPVMLTSAACERLGLSQAPAGVAGSRGIGSIGTMDLRPVSLEGAELRTESGAMDLGPMAGVVVEDFPQRKIGEEVGVSLDGMLGQGFLQRCDLEVNGPAAALRLWPPGQLRGGSEERWRLLPSLRLPGELQGLLLSVPGGLEPVVGVVDSGASHTVLNKHAAYVLGLEVASARSGQERKTVRGIGLDSSALEMPLVSVDGASLCGASHVTIVQHEPGAAPGQRAWSFRNVTCTQCERIGPLGPVEVAVGDIGFFEELLSQPQDSIGNFRGPAALLGQDLLAQLPLRISSSSERIWLREA